MRERFSDSRLRFFIGDIRDEIALENALGGVQDIIHAAALKRVDAGAYNPSEVVKTNVLGTMNVVQAAVRAGVSLALEAE
jgi:UDP-N-acetylglucosamine 4,6-dehydratase